MWADVGLSGVIARVNVLGSGWSQPGTHVGDCRPSVQRPSQRMIVSDMANLIERVGGCAPSEFVQEEGYVSAEIRATPFWAILTQARLTESSSAALAAAAAVSIVEIRARVKSEAIAGSSVTVNMLRRSVEKAISTREGVACLFPATTLALRWSMLEPSDELKELDVPL